VSKIIQIEELDDGYLVTTIPEGLDCSGAKRRVALTAEGAGYVAARLLIEEKKDD
jgi:hypothetical protein